MKKRTFEFARNKEGEVAFKNAQLPEYQTKSAAGADFFCAEEVTIPSLWKQQEEVKNGEKDKILPTLIHTGVKADMYEDEVLELYNRSSNPKKLGLILANSVGVVDSDYYGNPDNDGEIMFAFYNISTEDVTIKVGDRIGQGVFKKYLRPEEGLRQKEDLRQGGFGSTN